MKRTACLFLRPARSLLWAAFATHSRKLASRMASRHQLVKTQLNLIQRTRPTGQPAEEDVNRPTLVHPQRKSFAGRRPTQWLAVTGSLLLLFGCGGSNGAITPPGNNSGSSGATMSGTAVYGSMNGAAVKAFAISNGAAGAQLGTSTTDAQGDFTVSIGNYSGPVMLQVSEGSYTDDATGTTITMQPGDVMSAVVPSVDAGSITTGIQVTPLTSMAQARAQKMAGSMTGANIAVANAAMASYFSVGDVLHTAPMNPLTPGSGAGATQDAKNYGMTIAAMSEYAATVGMPYPSSVITAMMDDASDGVLNGMMGSTPISMGGMGGGMMQPTAGSTGLATAMTQFMASAMNRSGVTASDVQPLVTQLGGTGAQLPSTGGGSIAGAISGTAVYGPMSSGSMTAFAVTGGMMGAQLGSAATGAEGNFTVSIGNYSGPVMLQVRGGTYTDDATGTSMTMQASAVISALVPSVAASSTTTGIQVTALTSMAQARAQNLAGGMIDANIAAANAAMAGYFSVGDVLHTAPMNPLTPGSGAGATQEAKNYGMTIAAMSEYAKTIGMATSSEGIVTAMMEDASDGVLNGTMGSTSISMGGMGGGMMGGGAMMQANAGTSGMAAAMTAFVDDTSVNKSGVTATDMQALVAKLSTSNGTLQ